jgi:hypothetical protein
MKRSAAAGFVLGLVAALSAQAVAQDTGGQNAKEQNAREQNAREQNAREQNAKEQNAATKKASGRNASGREAASAEPVVVTVTTVTFAESTGCWARIHDGENFSGRTMTLMGSQSLPHLEFGIGSDWEGDIDSIEVGPKAKLVVYDDENFTDDPREIGPNGRVADLHQSLFSEGVESMKLSCIESSSLGSKG